MASCPSVFEAFFSTTVTLFLWEFPYCLLCESRSRAWTRPARRLHSATTLKPMARWRLVSGICARTSGRCASALSHGSAGRSRSLIRSSAGFCPMLPSYRQPWSVARTAVPLGSGSVGGPSLSRSSALQMLIVSDAAASSVIVLQRG